MIYYFVTGFCFVVPFGISLNLILLERVSSYSSIVPTGKYVVTKFGKCSYEVLNIYKYVAMEQWDRQVLNIYKYLFIHCVMLRFEVYIVQIS